MITSHPEFTLVGPSPIDVITQLNVTIEHLTKLGTDPDVGSTSFHLIRDEILKLSAIVRTDSELLLKCHVSPLNKSTAA